MLFQVSKGFWLVNIVDFRSGVAHFGIKESHHLIWSRFWAAALFCVLSQASATKI